MNRNYTFQGFTRTLCSECGAMIDGKIVYENDGVYILKNCRLCGEHFEILEEDTQYHLQKFKYDMFRI